MFVIQSLGRGYWIGAEAIFICHLFDSYLGAGIESGVEAIFICPF